jgi:hypothetical protein
MTPAGRAMQRQLFSVTAQEIAPVTDAGVWRMLSALRNAPELDSFRLFLVGSRLDPGNETSDIDLVLAPRKGSIFTDVRIERALWHCRHYGLYGATPACLIDPCFRRKGPTMAVVPLRPTEILQTARLFSPKLVKLVAEGRIRRCRRFGRYSIEYWRPAVETGFYHKLLQQRFDGVLCPYLRPGIEVTQELLPAEHCLKE